MACWRDTKSAGTADSRGGTSGDVDRDERFQEQHHACRRALRNRSCGDRPRGGFLVGRLLVLVIATSGCEASDPAVQLESRRAEPPPKVAAGGTGFVGLAPGDTVLGLRVDAVAVRPDPVDGFGWMGKVDYSGEVTLTGEYRPHFDFPEVREICFFADDSSAVRLPRFPNDVRHPWFCFSNQAEAGRMLGEPATRGRARIRIDRFSYHYRHTDVYNLGRLVDAELQAASVASPTEPEEPRR